jgi:hypothetical protein
MENLDVFYTILRYYNKGSLSLPANARQPYGDYQWVKIRFAFLESVLGINRKCRKYCISG